MSDSTFISLDSGFISKLLQTRDMVTVKDNQIRLQYLSGEGKSAYKFITDIVSSTGEVPTVRVFQRKFPNFKLERVDGEVGTEENLKYWCDELRNRVRHNTLVDTIEDAADKLKALDTEEALKHIRKQMVYIDSELTETKDVDITQDPSSRVKAYFDRKNRKGLVGLSSGIPALDYFTGGFEKKTLTTMIGGTGVGKSWAMILIGAYCQLQNCRVLQFVTEMSEEIMQMRYEAMLYAMCYGDLNYEHMRRGKLDGKTERKFIEFLENDIGGLEPLQICFASSVLGVTASIEKYKPDLVMIDSVYLMDDDQGAKEDWLRVAHITRDLKRASSVYDVPIFINTQANQTTIKRTGPELDSIMYTQAIGQDSNVVLALYADEVMRNDKEMGWKILKQREGVLGKFVTNWNFDIMDFSSIFSEKDRDDGKEIKDNTLGME